jgi:2-oxoglutarate dehydrogenase E2 component (dihydrolipoamide succinyltransferase)
MAIEVVVPHLGESILEATIGHWLKMEGEQVNAGEALVELETDKVNLEISAQRTGKLAKIERQEGDDVKVGDVIAVLEENVAAEKAAPADETAEEKTEKVDMESEKGQTAPASEATPVAKRMASELNINLASIEGTGPWGKITRANVEEHLKTAGTHPEFTEAPEIEKEIQSQKQKESPSSEFSSDHRLIERVKLSRRRRTIAQRLVAAQQDAAMLTTFNEINLDAIIDLRKRRNEAFQAKYGIKLGFISFFVKAAIGALKAYPQLNAAIQKDEMIIKHFYDIGVAVGASEGLVVPVLRDAGRLSFREIEVRVKEFAKGAEDGSLSIEDLRGGTFSITNGGVFGSLFSTPILNPPQSGILGLHKIEQPPIVVNGEIKIGSMMYVALTYDHRIVDGRDAVQFLVKIKELIEDPEALLIEA